MVSKFLLCPSTDMHDLITDSKAIDDAVKPFRELGIHILRVSVCEPAGRTDALRIAGGALAFSRGRTR